MIVLVLMVRYAFPAFFDLVFPDRWVFFESSSVELEALACYAMILFPFLLLTSTSKEPQKKVAVSAAKGVLNSPAPYKAENQSTKIKPEEKTQKKETKKASKVRITFDDIAGYKTTKESMEFIVQCMKNRSAIEQVGSKLPSGVILYGPPGTGKTLMAKAIAGTIGVPFFSINASSFINTYVGTGPAAVRDLFKAAREKAPSVVFIDEIDAIGGVRSGEENREYRSTLNALLSELDGFHDGEGVLTIAATNRLEDLDSALVRPGRFDRKIAIPLPNLDDRFEILKLHAKSKKLSESVDLYDLARETTGYSGAELATILNEAGIIAAANGKKFIEKEDIDKAIFHSETGGEEVVCENKKENEIVAWHEAGHALCFKLLCGKAVPRVTITGSTAGTAGTTFWADQEQGGISNFSKKNIENQIKAVYGGRAAEEIYFGSTDDVTAAASDDIVQATKIIKDYLMRFGMGEDAGPINVAALLGKQSGSDSYLEEAKSLAGKLYGETYNFLSENRDLLKEVANQLIKRGSLNNDELDFVIMMNKKRGEKNSD